MTKLVYIPFRQDMLKQIKQGAKTATSRPKQTAQIGDYFQVGDSYYKIVNITKKPLGAICLNHYKEEGCQSPQHFIDVWSMIHPIKGFDPTWMVYFHEFRKVY